MELFDFGHENHLKVFERLERGSLLLELVEVALNGRDLKGPFVEGVFLYNYFPGLFLACLERLILLKTF